jgi:hypothetical protein
MSARDAARWLLFTRNFYRSSRHLCVRRGGECSDGWWPFADVPICGTVESRRLIPHPRPDGERRVQIAGGSVCGST